MLVRGGETVVYRGVLGAKSCFGHRLGVDSWDGAWVGGGAGIWIAERAGPCKPSKALVEYLTNAQAGRVTMRIEEHEGDA
jgi:hypothetical protein